MGTAPRQYALNLWELLKYLPGYHAAFRGFATIAGFC
jgi:hypothetical protein